MITGRETRYGPVRCRSGELANGLGPAVACRENARSPGATVLRRRNIPLRIQLHQIGKGRIVRHLADGHKESLHAQTAFCIALRVPKAEPCQALRVTLQRRHHGIQNQLDVLPLPYPGQQTGLPPEALPPVNEIDLCAEIGEIQCILQRRIAAADHRHGLLPEEHAVTGGTVGQSASHQLRLLRKSQMPVPGTGGQNHRPTGVYILRRLHLLFNSRCADGRHLFITKRDAQGKHLLPQLLRIFIAGDARKARIIVDGRCIDDLSPAAALFQQQHRLSCPKRIDRRCHAGSARSHYNDVIHVGARLIMLPAEAPAPAPSE